MKQTWKLLSVLLLTVLFAVSASAQINWMKQDGNVKYLAWDNGSQSESIFNGQSATFATGYFGSTASKTVQLTVTLNSVNTGKIVSTIFSGNVDVSKTLAYKVFTVTPQDYKNQAGQYMVVIKVKDANTEYVDTSLFLQVFPSLTIFSPPLTVTIPINPVGKNTPPDINPISYSKDILETDTLQFIVSATDKEKDTLKYSAEECKVFLFGNCLGWIPAKETDLSFNENTGAFSWTLGYEYVQHYVPSLTRKALFRFKAIEVNGDKKSSNWAFVSVTVHDVNRNPVFDQIDPKHIKQGEDTSFTVNAADADKDELKYSIFSTNLPKQSYTFDLNSHKFTFTHGFTGDGVYTTVFQVDDDFGGVDYAVSYIVITPAPENKMQCNDEKDNDGDTLIDANDPGCHTDGDVTNRDSYDAQDNDESDEPIKKPQCSDGIDNDRDGAIDTHDPGCHTDGNADNGNSYDAQDNDESNQPINQPQCNDGKDNDRDGKIDFPADPGCKDNNDDNESDEPNQPVTQCNDGKDNDGDGLIDYGNNPRVNDPGCSNPNDNDESNYVPPPQKEPKEPIQIDLLSAHVVDEIEAGKTLWVDVRLHNDGKKEVKNLKVEAKIYDLGVIGSTGKFTLKAGKDIERNVYITLPEDAAPGWYLVKVTATNGSYHTSTYRLLYVDYYTLG